MSTYIVSNICVQRYASLCSPPFPARRRRRRVAWYNKPYTAKSLAIKALKNVRYIKGLVNSEMYSIIQSGSSGLNVGSSPWVLNLTGISMGDQKDQRTGNSVLLRNIYCRFQFLNHSSATATCIRMMLVLDTQTVADESTLSTTDILESNSTLSSLSTTTAGRFKVLKNYFFVLNNQGNTSKVITLNKPMYHHIRYNGTASADIQKGAIFLIAFSDQSSNTPTLWYNTKIKYHDN